MPTFGFASKSSLTSSKGSQTKSSGQGMPSKASQEKEKNRQIIRKKKDKEKKQLDDDLQDAIDYIDDLLEQKLDAIADKLTADKALKKGIREARETALASEMMTRAAAELAIERTEALALEQAEIALLESLADAEILEANNKATSTKLLLTEVATAGKEHQDAIAVIEERRLDGEKDSTCDQELNALASATTTKKEERNNAAQTRERGYEQATITATGTHTSTANTAKQTIARTTAANKQKIADRQAKEEVSEGQRDKLGMISDSTSVASTSYGTTTGIRNLASNEMKYVSQNTSSAVATKMDIAGGAAGLTVGVLGTVMDVATIGKNAKDLKSTDESRRRNAYGEVKSAGANIGIRSIDMIATSVGMAVTTGAATAAAAIAAPFVAATAGLVSIGRSIRRTFRAGRHKTAISSIDKTGVSSEMLANMKYAKKQLSGRQKKMGAEIGIAGLGVGASIALGAAAIGAIAGGVALMATPIGWGLAIGAAVAGLSYLAYKIYRKKYKKGGAGVERDSRAKKIVEAYMNASGTTADDKRAAGGILKALLGKEPTMPTTMDTKDSLIELVAKKLKSA